ncbi:MAG: hypothetical protein R3E31_14985 [Chloroflexota bacterium]
MRFIVREQPFEKPFAAGELRYLRDGQPTGAVEKWRVTTANGYQFLRVDLDARAAPSGHSYLYHALLNGNGRFERLKFRFWGDVNGNRLQVSGDIVFEETAITAYRTVNGSTYEQVLPVPDANHFWFPACLGLQYLGESCGTAVGLHTVNGQPLLVNSNGSEAFALFVVEMQATQQEDGATCYHWHEQRRTVWRNAAGWVVKMERGDGLTAVAVRTIQYQSG